MRNPTIYALICVLTIETTLSSGVQAVTNTAFAAAAFPKLPVPKRMPQSSSEEHRPPVKSLIAELHTNQNRLLVSQQTVERGTNYARVQSVTARGQHTSLRTNNYVRLGSAIHFRDGNEWRESRPHAAVQPDGSGGVRDASYSARFSPNINTIGAVQFSSGGSTVQSHAIAIFLHDRSTEQSAQISDLGDSIGAVSGDSEVVYTNAFPGIAHVRYRLRKAGIAQDIVFQPGAALPDPGSLGLNAAQTDVEIWTEFMPTNRPRLHFMTGTNHELASIRFGNSRIGAGTAFPLNSDSPRDRIPVRKEWFSDSGRNFLIEKLPYKIVRAQLDQMGRTTANPVKSESGFRVATGRAAPQPLHPATAARERTLLASSKFELSGFVADYELIDASSPPLILESGITYVLNDFMYTPQLTFEPGSVLKMGRDAGIEADAITAAGEQYNAVFVTTIEDDTIGEVIYDFGTTGVPSGYYASGGDLDGLREP